MAITETTYIHACGRQGQFELLKEDVHLGYTFNQFPVARLASSRCKAVQSSDGAFEPDSTHKEADNNTTSSIYEKWNGRILAATGRRAYKRAATK